MATGPANSRDVVTDGELPEATRALLEGSASGVSADHIRSVFERYGECLTAGDTDATLALFAPDAFIKDPATGPEQRGHEALRTFYQGGFDAMKGGIEMKLDGAVRIVGNLGAAAYIARTVNHDPVYYTETLDVMTFDENGLITSMIAYWGPSNFKLDAERDA